MNEEEVKIKIVLPFLRRLGIQDSELSFESSFSLNLGRNKVLINGKRSDKKSIGGRLDILVTRNGRNLLVLEIKEYNHILDDDDRKQAISYACLVDPIAPFTILTNGKDWQLFDTISKEKLEPSKQKLKSDYKAALPKEDYEEALGLFLGYSKENLLRFCHSQVAEHLKPLTGSPNDLTKKFIPELTVRRSTLIDQLISFETSSSNAFLLLAESGTGKTSALCDYVSLRLEKNKPTLFFAGVTLEAGLLSAISGEFGWTFTEELSQVELFRRLSGLVKDDVLIVVIDAIDEWEYTSKSQNLLNLIRLSNTFRIKFVFSCKTSAWPGISERKGSDIGFQQYLFCPTGTGSPEKTYTHSLKPFSKREFFRAVDNYRKVFGFNGAFEDNVLEEAYTNPFMLRVLFAVAVEFKQKYLTFSSTDFFRKYLDLLLRHCENRNIADIQLTAVAQLMFDQNTDSVSAKDLRKALSLSGNEDLLPALFTLNILQKQGDGYSFYFQHLRSYLIAFKICEWASKNYNSVGIADRTGVRGEALSFYFRHASSEQIRAITGNIWKHANDYLEKYKKLSSHYFPEIDRELVPGERAHIGFIGEYQVHQNALTAYGLFRREAENRDISLIPVDTFLSRSNLSYLNGAGSLRYVTSRGGFLSLDIQKEIVEHELIERVGKIISQRRLNLKGCQILGKELLVSLIWKNHRYFESLYDEQNRTIRFPVSGPLAEKALKRASLRFHFEDEITDKKRREGLIEEQWSGTGVSYSISFTREEKIQIEEQIANALETNNFPVFNGLLRNIEEIEDQLNRTDALNLPPFQPHPWKQQYFFLNECRQNYSNGLKLLQDHFKSLYEQYLECYKIVIDNNFSFFRQEFALRSQLPLRLFIEVTPFSLDSHDFDGRLAIAYEKLPEGQSNEVIMCNQGELKYDDERGIHHLGRKIGETYRIERFHRMLYYPGQLLLTDMVYSTISDEWTHVANQLRILEGLKKS